MDVDYSERFLAAIRRFAAESTGFANGEAWFIGENMSFDKTLLSALSETENKAVRRLFEKGVSIPPQPQVLQDLYKKLMNGEADVRAYAKLLAKDPGLVAMLFKVAQNASFRRYQPFESVEHILQAIGLQQTANLVRAIALSSSLPAKHNRKAFEAFWSRSQAISELAMLVAEERVAVCNIFPDQACLAGVFHDCGVPVLMQRFTTYCKDMCLDEPGRWTDLAEEDRRFNADHCVVGYLVGKHWKLPEFICDAIRYHHDLKHMGNHAARTMAAILQLAIQIYHEDRHLPNPEWQSVCPDVLDELGLGDDTLPELIDVVLEQYHGASPH